VPRAGSSDGGTDADAVCMSYADFSALTHPIVGRFTERMPM
jgi:hypothetical protein